MGFYKVSEEEKNKINILKLYFSLYPFFQEQKNRYDGFYSSEWLLENIVFIEDILLKGESQETEEIIYNSLIYRKKGLEYVAYSMYYSESGLRNKINTICLELLLKIE